MSLKRVLMAAAASAALATSAQAAVVVLDFEGIADYPNSNDVFVQDFYNGGTSSVGTSGTNYGISFGSNALLICLNSTSVFCSNTSRGGEGNPNSREGALFFLDGDETFMNVAAGFETGFSFNYVSTTFSGSVGVYDGLDGTGNLLASIDLRPNAGFCPDYSAGFCPFGPAGIAFAGIAKSVSFGGVANQIVFDDITFGSSIPDPDPDPNVVPLPASLPLLLAGLGGIAALRRRRRG
ncbi:MAG: VPLPA-CTERM sorting domain-containing protein [Gemmobacter sp.]